MAPCVSLPCWPWVVLHSCQPGQRGLRLPADEGGAVAALAAAAQERELPAAALGVGLKEAVWPVELLEQGPARGQGAQGPVEPARRGAEQSVQAEGIPPVAEAGA